MATGGNGGTRALLICRVGSRLCGIPLEHVIETMRPLPLERLGHALGYVDGLSLIRGRPTPVLDLRGLLEGWCETPARLGGADQPNAHERYVSLSLGDRRAALVVNAVLGVRHLDVKELGELPPLLREQNDLVLALGALDHELFVVLERARLVPEAVWAELDAQVQAP